jgi:hypothetical protein
LGDAEGGFGAQAFEPVRELLHAVPLLIELAIDPEGFRSSIRLIYQRAKEDIRGLFEKQLREFRCPLPQMLAV